ncbi:monofunctional biosynthetic peptidoglycan transglycosylase [Burkholderiaceae bacterium]
MRWLSYFLKCIIWGVVAIQLYFVVQITLWIFINPGSTAFQRAEHRRLCHFSMTCPIQYRWVPYAQIGNDLKRAILVSEDDIFFTHPGVRIEDMQKAWERNQKAGGKVVRGGSTITQQLAKNLFLSSEKNYFRKAQELIITGLLELILSKQRIFEIYMNSVEWGEGIFGIGAATQHYFVSSPKNITRDQAAALASALPAPKCFDKNKYCRRGSIDFNARQQFILDGMDRIVLPKSK